MPIVSELIEKRKKKQKESVNAIGRGNVLGVVKETEAVTPTVEEEGTEIENASVIVASRIEIMIVEVGEGQSCTHLFYVLVRIYPILAIAV